MLTLIVCTRVLVCACTSTGTVPVNTSVTPVVVCEGRLFESPLYDAVYVYAPISLNVVGISVACPFTTVTAPSFWVPFCRNVTVPVAAFEDVTFAVSVNGAPAGTLEFDVEIVIVVGAGPPPPPPPPPSPTAATSSTAQNNSNEAQHTREQCRAVTSAPIRHSEQENQRNGAYSRDRPSSGTRHSNNPCLSHLGSHRTLRSWRRASRRYRQCYRHGRAIQVHACLVQGGGDAGWKDISDTQRGCTRYVGNRRHGDRSHDRLPVRHVNSIAARKAEVRNVHGERDVCIGGGIIRIVSITNIDVTGRLGSERHC